MLRFAVFYLALFLSLGARAGFLTGLPETAPEGPSPQFSFLGPDEEDPIGTASFLEGMPAGGVLVAVGTERGWIDGALHGRPDSYLVFLDNNPDVIRFHLINRALLQLADGRADYLALRLSSPESEWNERASGSPRLDSAAKALLSARWAWWRDHVREPSASGLSAGNVARLSDFHRLAPPPPDEPLPFRDANYLFDDTLFARVQAFARAGHVATYQIDLTDTTRVAALGEAIARSALFLSLLDISNAWNPNYMKPEEVKALVKLFAPISRPESILLLTASTGQAKRPTRLFWAYFGFTFERLDALAPDSAGLRELEQVITSPGEVLPFGFLRYPDFVKRDGVLYAGPAPRPRQP